MLFFENKGTKVLLRAVSVLFVGGVWMVVVLMVETGLVVLGWWGIMGVRGCGGV